MTGKRIKDLHEDEAADVSAAADTTSVEEVTTQRHEANGSDTDPVSAAAAARHLKESLGRAWSDAKDTVRDVGDTWRRSATNVRAEARHATSETRDTLGDALGGMGELGEGIAEDTLDLARSVGINLERYVQRHPLRSVAIAAAGGALIALLLRGRR
jgi:ElaB/YqjD/DUF883 family membrane-anchored ribosome-binding protein